jgi:hypothetical protein
VLKVVAARGDLVARRKIQPTRCAGRRKLVHDHDHDHDHGSAD